MSRELPPGAGPVLTSLARRAIGRRLGADVTDVTDVMGAAPGDWLAAEGASFVTLTLDGELRGCIGSLEAYQPLADDVTSNARSAAFRDPRFPPLTAAEFRRVHIEVSVLSAPEPMAVTSEADALAQLRPGVDGVILAAAGRRATFLPQVWDQLPEPATFLAHLKRKAGLPVTYWGEDVRLWRYGVTAFEEPEEPGEP